MQVLPSVEPVRIEVLWSAQGALGVAFTVIDVLRVIQSLASIRAVTGRPALSWRWRALPGERLPHWLAPMASQAPTGRQLLPDLLVLPGWLVRTGPELDQRVRQSAALLPRLQAVHAQGGLLVAVGDAAALLGAAGLLRGREAVAPWPFVAAVLRHSEGVQLQADRPWVQSDRIWTCDTPVWTAEILLDALRHTRCTELALAASHVLLHSPERQQVASRIEQDIHNRRVPPGAVERARRWLEQHLVEPYDLDRLAQAAATSPRTLLRHFAATHGKSPLQYLCSLRLARAQMLLETTYLAVDQLAQACGYADVGTFRRHFLRATGELPAAYRERHRLRTRRSRWTA
jgi:transcriptional regulator GlxA family with amidase domain